MQESGAAGRYIYEMGISETKEVNMNSIHAGRLAPPVPAQPAAAQKPKSLMSDERALGILKVVTVGKIALNIADYEKKDKAVIITIAEGIISAIKSGMDAEFKENGRIFISEDLFNGIVKACEKGPDRNLNIFDGVRPQVVYPPKSSS